MVVRGFGTRPGIRAPSPRGKTAEEAGRGAGFVGSEREDIENVGRRTRPEGLPGPDSRRCKTSPAFSPGIALPRGPPSGKLAGEVPPMPKTLLTPLVMGGMALAAAFTWLAAIAAPPNHEAGADSTTTVLPGTTR